LILKKYKLFLCIFISFVLFFGVKIYSENLEIEPWNSDIGMQRLERSTHKVDFFKLANHFEPQNNKLYCGLASSTIVLNTLRTNNKSIKKPQDQTLLKKQDRAYLPESFDPIFERYTQNNLYSEGSKSKLHVLGKPITLNGEAVKDYGLQLHQLNQLLIEQGLNSKIQVVNNDLSNKQIKSDLIENMKTEDDYILINYHRSELGQKGGGHVSPLGAYDKESDSFLILDVNPNKADWVWVNTKTLIKAMRTFDTIENRGYLILKEQY
jgi:hypothetical protein